MSPKNLIASKKTHKFLFNKLKDKDTFKIYKKFEKDLNLNEDFIVAVSGGADSLALSFLSKIYSIKNKHKVKYFHVDHKLRNNSTNEAKLVKLLLKKLSSNIEIVTWIGKKPKSNIQSVARDKRYQLLMKQAKKLKINNILLGHHMDDLIENFFIRILRGSGLKGLISLDEKNRIGDKNILRPLITEKKENLIYVSKHVFNYYVKDPSNKNEKFQRIKIRNLILELEKNGLQKEKFLKTIRNLKQSDTVVNFYVNETLKNNTFFSTKKNQFILDNKFFKQPHEIIFRAFSDIIRIIGKKYYPVRGKKLDRLIKEIKNKTSYKSTLGGCLIEKVSQTVTISREF